jgi:hypothetical protein
MQSASVRLAVKRRDVSPLIRPLSSRQEDLLKARRPFAQSSGCDGASGVSLTRAPSIVHEIKDAQGHHVGNPPVPPTSGSIRE